MIKINRERERERERRKIELLRKRIKILENAKGSMFWNSEREQELKNKKKELAKLDKDYQEQDRNKTKYWPWIIGGVVLVGIVGIFIYFLTRKKDKKIDYE